jgi:hypothetical protein
MSLEEFRLHTSQFNIIEQSGRHAVDVEFHKVLVLHWEQVDVLEQFKQSRGQGEHTDLVPESVQIKDG